MDNVSFLMGLDNLSETWNNSTNQTSRYSLTAVIGLAGLVSFLILFTIVGNVLVVIAVLTSRALKPAQNLFLVSLASADILVATLIMPFSLANELMGYWPFGQVWCDVYLALDVLFCTSSIVHLCAISLDRYWSVTQAVEYNLKRTPARVKATIAVVWLISAVISFPPLISVDRGDLGGDGQREEPQCIINDHTWYILYSCVGSFFAPCVIMVLVYVRIYQVAKTRTRGMSEKRAESGDTPDGPDHSGWENGHCAELDADLDDSSSSDDKSKRSGPRGAREHRERRTGRHGSTGSKRSSRKSRASSKSLDLFSSRRRNRRSTASRKKISQAREKRFTFVLAVVMGVFVVCWFPFFFSYSLYGICRELCAVPKPLFKFFFWIGYCNSSLNPVIYTIFNQDFRRAFHKILCGSLRRSF